MATGESWPKAHRRPSREDAMADAECAEWKEGGSRWFGAAAMSCCCGAADYGLWKGWRQMFSPTAIRCPVLRLTPDGLSVAMPWWRRVVDSDPMLGKLQKERFAGTEQKKRSGVPADKGPASTRPGRAPTMNSPPLQSIKAMGQWQATISTFLARARAQGPAAAPRSVRVWAGAATMTLA